MSGKLLLVEKKVCLLPLHLSIWIAGHFKMDTQGFRIRVGVEAGLSWSWDEVSWDLRLSWIEFASLV